MQHKVLLEMQPDSTGKMLTEDNNNYQKTLEIINNRLQKFKLELTESTFIEESGQLELVISGNTDESTLTNILLLNSDFSIRETYENSELIASLIQLNNNLRSLKDTTNNKKEEPKTNLEDQPVFYKLIPLINVKNRPIEGPAVGYAKEKDTVEVIKMFNSKTASEIFPIDVDWMWEINPNEEGYFKLIAVKKISGENYLSGEHIQSTDIHFEEHMNSYSILFQLDEEGSNKWEKLTEKNIGRSLSMVLNNKVYSYPVVQDKISGGSAKISGDFTKNEAKNLALVLLFGGKAFPLKFKILEVTRL